jgi:hypothetical protein
LHCYYSSYNSDNALTADQHRIFKRLVENTDASWQEIPASELEEYGWQKLIQQTRDFIEHYTPLYDEVTAAVWGHLPIPMGKTNTLTEKPVPKGIMSLPGKKQIQYAANADYDSENKRKKNIGNGGESLVIQLEKKNLTEQGKPDLAAAVGKALDWQGYDILSYYPDGRSKFVEVKTTAGTNNRPFFWTWNERETMLKHAECYCLYRLYNYDEGSNTADFFKLEGDISGLILEEPIQYNVYVLQV